MNKTGLMHATYSSLAFFVGSQRYMQFFCFPVGELCGNWDPDATFSNWCVTSKQVCIIVGYIMSRYSFLDLNVGFFYFSI